MAVSGESTSAEGACVDVILHPWVLARCAAEAAFKREVAALALRWVSRELPSVVLDATPGCWKLINSRYKGGGGARGDEPLPFPLERAATQARPPDQRAKAKARRCLWGHRSVSRG